MPELNGSKTHENLSVAFARDSQANHRYLWFAQQADVEGHPAVAAIFRSIADGETGHAHGHLEFLADVGDPASGKPIGATAENLEASIAGETYESVEMFPAFARTAREEGFEAIAVWFETLTRTEQSQAERFRRILESLMRPT
jgi:rubrerythrin